MSSKPVTGVTNWRNIKPGWFVTLTNCYTANLTGDPWQHSRSTQESMGS